MPQRPDVPLEIVGRLRSVLDGFPGCVEDSAWTGLVLDDDTDWEEPAELPTDSYCIQAPAKLADEVTRP